MLTVGELKKALEDVDESLQVYTMGCCGSCYVYPDEASVIDVSAGSDPLIPRFSIQPTE